MAVSRGVPNVPEQQAVLRIHERPITDSLAHRYGQAKLDAITSLVEGFENAVYLGTLPDLTRQEGVNNHYFAFPINYKGERCYVFCRAMQDANKNRLYVHEVFVADNIKKGNTLQTAASKPHGGIALYRDILANVLDNPMNKKEKGIATNPTSASHDVKGSEFTAPNNTSSTGKDTKKSDSPSNWDTDSSEKNV